MKQHRNKRKKKNNQTNNHIKYRLSTPIRRQTATLNLRRKSQWLHAVYKTHTLNTKIFID